MAILKVIKETTKLAVNTQGVTSSGLAQVSLATAVRTMAERRIQVVKRIEGVPSSQGLQNLLITSLDFTSISALNFSIARIAEHALVSSQILAKLIERKRQDEILDSSKSIAFINEYLDANGYVTQSIPSATVKLPGVRTNAIADALQRVGLFINQVQPGSMVPELIHAMMHMPSSEIIPNEVMLNTNLPTYNKVQAISQLYEEIAALATDISTVVPYEKLSSMSDLTEPLEEEAIKVAYSNIGLVAAMHFLDNLLSFIMDSTPQGLLLQEVYTKTPLAQNTTRRVTLESICMYFHSFLQTTPMLTKELVDAINKDVHEFTGYEWKLAPQILENYKEFVGHLEHPRYKRMADELNAAINTEALKPYSSYPKVVFEDCLYLSGNGQLAVLMKIADKLVPEVGVITDLTGMLDAKVRALVASTSLLDHNYFSNQANYIRTSRRYEALLYDLIGSVSAKLISNISPESKRRADEAVEANVMPFIGSIATISVPMTASPVEIADSAVLANGATPLTEVMKVRLTEDDVIFRYFGMQAFKNKLSDVGTIIVHDESMASYARKMAGIDWNALYPMELLEGQTEYLGMPGSNVLMQNLGLIGRLIGRSPAHLQYDVEDPLFKKLLATAMSSSHSLVILGRKNSSLDSVTIDDLATISVVEGYGQPFGLSYASLFDECYVSTLAADHMLSDIRTYGMTLNADNTLVLIPHMRYPIPAASFDDKQAFGPMGAKIPVTAPITGGYVKIKDRTIFVKAKSLKQFTLGGLKIAESEVKSYISLFGAHAAGYLIDTVNYTNEFTKAAQSNFPLPSVKEWNYASTATFLRYIWYKPYHVTEKTIAVESDASASQTADQKNLIKTIQAKSEELAAKAASATVATDNFPKFSDVSKSGGVANSNAPQGKGKKKNFKKSDKKPITPGELDNSAKGADDDGMDEDEM